MNYSIGIMQGRLTEPKGRGIQFFPFENWKREFYDSKKIGLNEIEFIFDYDNFQDNPLWSKEGIAEIKRTVNDSGINVRSICFDYFMRRPFYKFPKGEIDCVLKENTETLKRLIDAMNTLNIELIEIPSVDNSSLKSEVEKEQYINWLRSVAEENKNIKFGMETDLFAPDFLSVIERINLSNVGANYDSGNSSGLGYDLYEEVTCLKDHIFNIHIKDRKYKGYTVQLGTGDAKLEDLFLGLREIKYNNSFILQAARGEEGKEFENIMWQKNYLCNLIDKYLGKLDV